VHSCNVLSDTFPFSLAAFAASLSGFQILCARGKQVHKADKPSNFERLSWNAQISDLRKASVKISQNSVAVLRRSDGLATFAK